MEVSQVRGISSRSSSPQKSSNEEESMELRRGPWTLEEDLVLRDYIYLHGEGRWNSLARCAGLKRTGKSCRLRWLNYLRPDVRRGNISLEEQLQILELHSRWGNRWSKIAQQLPGRTDNEIKNYWRTRVQKHAKQLKCDVNSKQFKDTMRYLWMPRLFERIQAASSTAGPQLDPAAGHALAPPPPTQLDGGFANNGYAYGYGTPENCSSTGASSDSFGPQVSPVSELADNYNFPVNSIHPDTDYYIQGGQQQHHSLSQLNSGDQFSESLISPCGYLNDNTTYGLENFQSVEQSNNQWFDSAHAATEPDNLWNVDDIWFLQQQFGNASM